MKKEREAEYEEEKEKLKRQIDSEGNKRLKEKLPKKISRLKP